MTTDKDAVWLSILRRDPSLRGKTPAQVRRVLTADGFPQRFIARYLAEKARKIKVPK